MDSLLGMHPEKPADPTIVATICQERNFRISRPQTLELLVANFPYRDTIAMSLTHHEAWFQHDRRLIWNTDEMQWKILKWFRCFARTAQCLSRPHAPIPIYQRNRLSFGRCSGIKTDYNSEIIGTLRWFFWSRISLRICSIDELVDYKRTLDLLNSRIFGIDKWISVFFAPEMRNSEMLLIIDGHKSGLNFITALIFWPELAWLCFRSIHALDCKYSTW
jgi:hypothetical protein